MTNEPKNRQGQQIPQAAAPMSDEEFERFFDELVQEFGTKESKHKNTTEEDLLSDVPVRRIPSPYDPKPVSQEAHHQAAPARKGMGLRGLVTLICLECLGIAGVVLWWMLRIL